MRRIVFSVIAVAAPGGAASYTAPVSGQSDEEAAPIYGIKIPAGYRDWKVISVAQVGPPINDIRIKLGNEIANKAYRDSKLPFPDLE